jgi:DNA (cytosine-5)-methyltransferase 1
VSSGNTLRVGSLCTGYGGLDLAATEVLGGTTAWVSDIDKGANKILAHRYPEVPNLGDFTNRDWSTVEPVDVLTAGFPCQPVSHAGKRLGSDDERWLWDDVARAVRDLRPGLVLLENVRGLLTAGGGRLFGRVLGALADLGYDAQWHGLRAADVGAAHARFRVFIVAADTGGQARDEWPGLRADVPPRDGWGQSPRGSRPALLGTPRASEWKGSGPVGSASHQHWLEHDYLTAQVLQAEAGRLLPTPMVGSTSPAAHNQISGQYRAAMTKALTRWGDYAAAIACWEDVLGRPAPAATQLSARGNPQLAPRFVEWLMGLPAGWVTDVPEITRSEALKALGNGVVPQQSAAALRYLLPLIRD